MHTKVVNKHIVVVLKTLNQDIPVSKKQIEKSRQQDLQTGHKRKYF